VIYLSSALLVTSRGHEISIARYDRGMISAAAAVGIGRYNLEVG